MKFTELKKNIAEQGVKSVYLLEGEEVYFRDRGIELFKSMIEQPSLNYTSFDGASLKGSKIADLVDSVYAFPFLSEKRMVLVSEFYPSEQEFNGYIKPLLDAPVETTVLVIANTVPPKGKKNYVDLKRKSGITYVDCSRAEESDITKWIFLTFKRAGIVAGGDVCTALMNYCAYNMARIAKETEKLVEYLGEGARLDMDTVDALVYRDSEYKMYELTQAVSRRDFTTFTKIMTDMVGKGYDENAFLNALCSHFKTLYELSAFKGNNQKAAETFSMKEYAVKKQREQAGKFSMEALFDYYTGTYTALARARAGEIGFSAALQTVIDKIFFKTY